MDVKDIVELSNIIAERPCSSTDCSPCIRMGRRCNDYLKAERVLNAGFVRLPVKPGDTVYIINHNKITEWKVCFVGINLLGDVKFHVADEGYHNVHEFWDYNIGVCVFLTEEDAINELKERKSYDNT